MDGGIISPNGESVFHNSEWVPAIISPDGDLYFYSGEWYPLAGRNDSSEESDKRKIGTRNNESYDSEYQISKDIVLKQIFSGVACLFLVWVIFDTGGLVSNWKVATQVDCSELSDLQDLGWDDLEADCDEIVSSSQLEVCCSFIGIIWLIGYILKLNAINPRTKLEQDEKDRKERLEQEQKNNRKLAKIDLRGKISSLKKRGGILRDLEKNKIKLSEQSLTLENMKIQHNWDEYVRDNLERRAKFQQLCTRYSSYLIVTSTLPVIYISTNHRLFLETTNEYIIYVLLGLSILLLVSVFGIPWYVYKLQFSDALIQDDNPVPNQIIEVERTSTIISDGRSRLRELGKIDDGLNDESDISEIKYLIRKFMKNLEELEIED